MKLSSGSLEFSPTTGRQATFPHYHITTFTTCHGRLAMPIGRQAGIPTFPH